MRAARDAGAECIVVGLPRSLDGTDGPTARATLAEIDALRAAAGDELPVHGYDERLTTVIAQRSLRAAGVRPARGKQLVDGVAAAVILQSWLDAQR